MRLTAQNVTRDLKEITYREIGAGGLPAQDRMTVEIIMTRQESVAALRAKPELLLADLREDEQKYGDSDDEERAALRHDSLDALLSTAPSVAGAILKDYLWRDFLAALFSGHRAAANISIDE